jgi:hypothetical protein
MGLFKHKKDDETKTKCETCGTELHDPERLKKHMKKHMETYLLKNWILMVAMVELGKWN